MSKIAGPGGPFDHDQNVVDLRDAVLMDAVNVIVVGAIREKKLDEIVLALELEGRINKRQERSDVIYIFNVDGAAAIISELFGLAQRIGPEFQENLLNRLASLPQPESGV